MNGENYIFTIAIDKYNGKDFKMLNNAKHDAKSLSKVLCNKYGFKSAKSSLFDKAATREGIIEAINELSSLTSKDDSLIIYFAGHGTIHQVNGIGYMIPSDAKWKISDWISNNEFMAYISAIKSKHLVLISDSCFSGSLLTLTRGDDGTHHYLKLRDKKSRWVLTSGRLETVDDGKPGSGSPFANSLIEALLRNEQKFYSITELFVYVQKQVGSSNPQQPVFNAIPNCGHEGGQLVFEIQENKVKTSKKKRTWEENFKIFLSLKQTRPEWPYISRQNPETKEMGIWCTEQRMAKKENRIIPSREQKLIEIGFSFDPYFDKFYRGLGKFLAFMRKTGLNNVPKKLSIQYRSEDAWHRQQQKFYAKSPCDPNNPKSYPKYRYDELVKNEIPIETTFKVDQWKNFKEGIIDFYKANKKIVTLPSQNDKDKKISDLGHMVNDYMVRWKRGQLSQEQIKFLSEYIDIDYLKNKHKRELELQIQKYLAFREKFPKENPSTEERKQPDIKWVLNWKATNRKRFSGDTSEENKWRIERLNQINFPWYSDDKKNKGTSGKQTALWN